MKFEVNGKYYDIVIDKKDKVQNTYIRVKKDLTIYVSTSRFTSNHAISKLIDENYEKIVKMIEMQQKKKENNEGFYYLGEKYDIV